MKQYKADAHLFYTLFQSSTFYELQSQLLSMSPTTVEYMIESFDSLEPYNESSYLDDASAFEVGSYRLALDFDNNLIIETLPTSSSSFASASLF